SRNDLVIDPATCFFYWFIKFNYKINGIILFRIIAPNPWCILVSKTFDPVITDFADTYFLQLVIIFSWNMQIYQNTGAIPVFGESKTHKTATCGSSHFSFDVIVFKLNFIISNRCFFGSFIYG